MIVTKLIVRRPLNPSIKFAPLIINRKHNKIKIVEKKLICRKSDKKGKLMLEISKDRMWIEKKRKIVIKNNLLDGPTLILISSKKPIKNIKLHKTIYSNKIFK